MTRVEIHIEAFIRKHAFNAERATIFRDDLVGLIGIAREKERERIAAKWERRHGYDKNGAAKFIRAGEGEG